MILLQLLHSLDAALRGSWRFVCARCLAPQVHREIDAAALRDLGLDRSELGSVQAEAQGRAASTRLRIVTEARCCQQGTTAQQTSNAASNAHVLRCASPSTLQAKDI
jgi:3-deoxy-D-arabino-heptulosonate 7-phosphate (DAHP) synthase